MIRVMGFTEHVSVWVSIVCLTSAVFISGCKALKLTTYPQVEAKCGGNVTLFCVVGSTYKMDIKLFSWLAKNSTECKYEDGHLQLKGRCENTPESMLSLTLTNVMPSDGGEYRCKVATTTGVKQSTTNVIVQDCPGSSTSSINSTQAKCWFTGVYPMGSVHWSQGDVNLTGSARTGSETDEYQRHNIWSTIDVEQNKFNQSYQCCLWRSSSEDAPSCQTLKLTSAGQTVKLQWICVVMEILLVRFIMNREIHS